MEAANGNSNSQSWIYYCYANFVVAAGILGIGIWQAELSLTFQAFLTMGALYITSSAFNLAKVVRDEFEASKLHYRLDEAKTERLLRDVEAA
ncbi:MAG: YiaA/YiaB family inner membrane protein [Pseudomonadota bacterium]